MITNIIITTPPFSSISGKEGLDLALVCAAFDHQVNLIFQGRGLLHLVVNQQASEIEDKLHDKQLLGLEFYDIHQVYYLEDQRSKDVLKHSNLLPDANLLTPVQYQQLIEYSNHTVVF